MSYNQQPYNPPKPIVNIYTGKRLDPQTEWHLRRGREELDKLGISWRGGSHWSY